jgi:hypothetical protein
MTVALASLFIFSIYTLPETNVAQGSMEFECLPPVVLNVQLALPNRATLSLHILVVRKLEIRKLTAAAATWCTASGKCEAARASVEFKHLNLEKRATGSYHVEFDDGRKSDGIFSATKKKQAAPFLCE